MGILNIYIKILAAVFLTACVAGFTLLMVCFVIEAYKETKDK